MKYYFRRIICGVAIGLILFYCKSCEVHAATTYKYLRIFDSVGITADFDICKSFNDDYMCVDGFSTTKVLDNNSYTLYRNTSNDLFLKSFSMVVNTTPNVDHSIYLRDYFSITGNIATMFSNARDIDNKRATDYNLIANQVLSKVTLEMEDGTICEINDTTNVGNSYQSNIAFGYPSFKVPSNCRLKYVKNMTLTWQSGYNYNGPKSNMIYDINIPNPFVLDTYLANNKNNTYLQSFKQMNVSLNSGILDLQFYTSDSSYYQSTFKAQNYTYIDESINENITQLEKEVLLASLGGGGSSDNTGPSSPDSEQYDNIDDGFDGVADLVGTSISGASFNDFLTALTQKPIAEILWIEEHFDQGGTYCPSVDIPLKVTKDYYGQYVSQYHFSLPCMRNIYRSIPFVDTDPAHVVYGWNIKTLWQIILKGYLMYLLVLTWLNIVKYTISRSQSEIEVIEL